MEDASNKPLILLLDGNSAHAQQIVAILNQTLTYCIEILADGLQALDFLYQRGEYATASRPALILLDLNLPQKSGREILAEIKVHPTLKRIPIVVLATSTNSEDIFSTYRLQGNCYVIKSGNLAELSQTVKRIEEFWLGIVTLPSQ